MNKYFNILFSKCQCSLWKGHYVQYFVVPMIEETKEVRDK